MGDPSVRDAWGKGLFARCIHDCVEGSEGRALMDGVLDLGEGNVVSFYVEAC